MRNFFFFVPNVHPLKLLFGNQNKKDRKVLTSFFHIYVIAEMFDLHGNIYLIAKKFFVPWLLCCSPEDEPWHSWLGTAAKAGKGTAQMQTTRPPSANHTTGQRSTEIRLTFKLFLVLSGWIMLHIQFQCSFNCACVCVYCRRQEEGTRCPVGWTMTGTHRRSSHPWMSGSGPQTTNQHLMGEFMLLSCAILILLTWGQKWKKVFII